MAEAHPVGFQWVMEAKKRGAKVIHVDPRFTRTSALADLHVPIRAGADIAFVGGLINYVLTKRQVLPRVRDQLHQRGHDRDRGLRRHRGPGRGVLRAGPRAPAVRPGDLAVPGRRRGAPGGGERSPGDDRPAGARAATASPSGGPRGGARIGRCRRASRGGHRHDAAAPAVRVPGAEAPLRPVHAGGCRRGHRGARSRPSRRSASW